MVIIDKLCVNLLVWIIIILFPWHVQANHIYGGNMSLQAMGTNNTYKLSLILYFDKRNVDPALGYESPTVYLFRKKDNIQVARYYLPLESQQDLFNTTDACNNLLPLSILQIRYSAMIALSKSDYSDAQGYYVIWERCCRNRDIINLNNPGNTGMTFRMDFPPVVNENKAFVNSSPEFTTPPADYVCIAKPYKISFKATDIDGDRLMYELVDPLAGYTSEFPETNRIGSGQSRADYPPANWNPGYNAQHAIPGNPTLLINPNTGEMTVTASTQGLYAFAVVIHEFRNGKELGQVRREFQLPVIDCKLNQTVPTPPIIQVNGQLISSFQNCDRQSVTLKVDREAGYAYQWRKNGLDIDGENQDILTVSQDGTYSVLKKFIQNCGRDTLSQGVSLYCDTQVYVPTAFSPNGDGQNDVWVLYPSNPVSNLEVTIFDRWGNIIFHSIGYTQPWDGTYKSQRLPAGIYSYRIQAPNITTQTGIVQLILY